MCLAVPGRVDTLSQRDDTLMAEVDFGGVRKDVCCEYVPDVKTGDYVIVHVGFAIQRLDEESALRTLAEFETHGDPRGGVRRPGRARRAPGRRRRPRQRQRDHRRQVEVSDEVPRRVQQPRPGQAAARPDPRRHVRELGDHGGLRRADPLDHPARHRPAAARRDRDDPRPGLPGLRHPAGGHRQGARDRPAPRRDLLLVRRHAAGARAAARTCSASRARAATSASSTPRSTRSTWPARTRTSRWCSSASASRPRRRPTR